jgi:hypothetical protein
VQFLKKRKKNKFSPAFLVIKTLDPDPEPDRDSLEMLDPDSTHPDHNTGM